MSHLAQLFAGHALDLHDSLNLKNNNIKIESDSKRTCLVSYLEHIDEINDYF
jgi:hypothetical protein